MNFLRWSLCLPAAVVAYVAMRILCVTFFFIILSIPKLSPIKFPFPSFDEWNAVIRATDMHGSYINGTWWLFFLSFIPSLTATMAVMMCAPSHKKAAAISVASIGTICFIGSAIVVAASPLIEQTFSFWYRNVLEIVASITGFGTVVTVAIKAEREQNRKP